MACGSFGFALSVRKVLWRHGSMAYTRRHHKNRHTFWGQVPRKRICSVHYELALAARSRERRDLSQYKDLQGSGMMIMGHRHCQGSSGDVLPIRRRGPKFTVAGFCRSTRGDFPG